jgi:hypothetical protein
MSIHTIFVLVFAAAVVAAGSVATSDAQLVDRTVMPNAANEGIAKSLTEQVGAGQGDVDIPASSVYLIQRDPFRAIKRGRQIFQRKFVRAQGQGPLLRDGNGDLQTRLTLAAGLSDSCALCHGRPRGSAGAGGNVVTRPDSRDAPHLFGVGLKEMLADEITADLREIRRAALAAARSRNRAVTRPLVSKGIHYGSIIARPDGSLDASRIEGVDADLRVRPFFAHGGTISLREFISGALQAEMGLQAHDPALAAASRGGRVVTPAGMVLDGALDRVEAPAIARSRGKRDVDRDGVRNEVPVALVDYLEFYLLNYFKPGRGEETVATAQGSRLLARVGCTRCHVPDLLLERDRRVADVETAFDPERGIFNRLFATATPLFRIIEDRSGHPPLKRPRHDRFLVRDIFTDFKRHDLGPAFHERNYDGTVQTQFLTAPLWGVGSTGPYGHDGRSISLAEVIRRHGGAALAEREAFVALSPLDQLAVIEFLNSLVLFPPDDTASNLNPGDPAAPGFPQSGHGSISLTVLFNDPTDPE